MSLVSGLGDVAKTIGNGVRLLPGALSAVAGQIENTLHDDIESGINDLKKWAQAQNPEPIFSLLRRFDPILVKGDFAVVTRFADVQEVLSRDDVFHVTYTQKFGDLTEGANFILGMQNTPEYTRDTSLLRMVIRREDIAQRIMPLVADTTERIVADKNGRLDFVTDIGNAVPVRMVSEYVGLAGSEPGVWAQQSAVMSGYLFLPAGNDPDSGREAVSDAKAMRAEIAQQIAARKQARGRCDDVLERCLVLQDAGTPGMSDDDICLKLFGIVVAIIPTTSAVAARALDELLNRPEELARAHRAALADDYATVWQFINECGRFNPLGPGVFRSAAADYTLAKGTPRAKTIPQGANVLAALSSAMMDSSVVDSPNDFKLDRPPYVYMPFGYGIHTCFGQYINAASLPRMLLPLLRRKNLRRAPEGEGKLVLDGPFPSHLVVEYDA